MASEADLRAAVAEQLTTRSVAGGPLHREAAECTEYRYATDVRRAQLHKHLIDRYLARENPRRDGRSAIVTAGAPGSGKSSMLRTVVPDLGDYRVIDADIIKDYLIEQALDDGIYDHLRAVILADGHALAPRELAALVHLESVKLADQIRRLCIIRKENIVVEGTLTWDGQGPRIFRELADSEYTDIEVYGVDIGQAGAHEQALARWWQGRQLWVNNADPFGGRFTPADAIDICYTNAGVSVCTTHAMQFIDTAQSGEIPHVHVSILGRNPSGALEVTDERHYRQ
ncbi:zeta toxin protein [Mycobacterium dioxanotrophicus]|uniref:UDP-N-acetylglucosamine kinase n=1 Tax=Mycobacterium dioxanotrophicus TaxID=482462 RepID=A0A1Y0BWN1_9MYCO|nr:zeta toxin family protein [Mycobacterium dioxanotrophicus]ART67297.1 zeta toxin protein [Mycobacterium dioxanotrophicus]